MGLWLADQVRPKPAYAAKESMRKLEICDRYYTDLGSEQYLSLVTELIIF